MSKIDSAYDYYMMTYGKNEVSRYDAHKKSELRNVYNRMVKANKESPLYKLVSPDDAKRYAIDIKENAKAIQNVVASLSTDSDSGIANAFTKKVATSSHEDVVDAKYIGDGTEDSSTDQFTIEVQHLAAPQINTGKYIESNALSLVPGGYSFDLNTNSGSYEFQYNVNVGDTNKDVQQKLSRLINTSGLGLNAEILERKDGHSALQIASRQTGLAEGEDYLFQINPGTTQESIQAMDLLGINHVTSEARNSSFLLNDVERNSFSNTFSINQVFELTLKNTSSEHEPAVVGFKANVDAVADNIGTLVTAYNDIIKLSREYSEAGTFQGTRLYNDMSGISKNHKSDLESIGLMVDSEGSIYIDKELLADAITPERSEETFGILSDFKDSIGTKAENASINPMNYVDKVVVAYKNPGHNFATPYITSIYSGMMLDNYI